MPADPALLHQLAAQLAPAATLLIAPVAAQLPALTATDVAGVESWLTALTDAQLATLVDALPVTILTAAIKRSLAATPTPALARPVSGTSPRTPLATINGDPNVDREPIWNSFEQLLFSDQRLFVVTGTKKVGKSRTVELLRLFIEARRPAHRFVAVNLSELRGVEAVVDALHAAVGVSKGLRYEVPTREVVLAAIPRWATTVATGVFNAIRQSLGDQVTPWFVFDHVGDMLAPDDGSVSSFFGQFAEEVGNERLRANAPRAIFIAHEPLNGFAKFTLREDLQPVTEDQVHKYYQRRGHPDPAAKAMAKAVVAQAKADCAAENDLAEVRFMSNLGARL